MDTRLSDALGAIYDAAVTPSKWRHALDHVAAMSGAKGMALVIRDDPTGARNKTLLSTPYLEFSRTIRGMYYGAVLDRHQNSDWRKLEAYPPLLPVVDTEGGVASETYDKRPDYRSLRRNVGVSRRMAIRLNEDKVWFDAMSLGYDQSLSQPTPLDPNAKVLLPHLSRAVEVSRMFFQLQHAYRAALAALDHVAVALAVARADGQVLVANARAQALFEGGHGLSKSQNGALKTSDADTDAQLEAAIAAACATACGDGAADRDVIVVPRPALGHPLLIDIVPLRDSGAELEPGLAGAMITVIDPLDMPDVPVDRFVAAYGLTLAESEVCRLLISGAALDEIAETRGTSPVTVKNQVASILSKTGAAGRADLMRLLLRILPPIT